MTPLLLWLIQCYFSFSVPSPANILLKSQAVFSDVQDEFCDVKKILSRFEEWRGSYSDSYHNAYIALCLPKLLNPIIRHQLLAWDPLKVPKYMEYVYMYVYMCIIYIICGVGIYSSRHLPYSNFLCLPVRMLVATLKISHGSQQWRPFVMGTAMRNWSTQTDRHWLIS